MSSHLLRIHYICAVALFIIQTYIVPPVFRNPHNNHRPSHRSVGLQRSSVGIRVTLLPEFLKRLSFSLKALGIRIRVSLPQKQDVPQHALRRFSHSWTKTSAIIFRPMCSPETGLFQFAPSCTCIVACRW